MRRRGNGRGGSGRGASAGLLRWVGLAVTAAMAVVGVALYLDSPAHQRHDPNHGLQQLDLLYLDEPAPGLRQLGIEPGRPALVVFCASACALPELDSPQVVRSTDRALAARYALVGAGRVGPGYALIDARGYVRYRTFDPGLADHEPEIRILIEGMS